LGKRILIIDLLVCAQIFLFSEISRYPELLHEKCLSPEECPLLQYCKANHHHNIFVGVGNKFPSTVAICWLFYQPRMTDDNDDDDDCGTIGGMKEWQGNRGTEVLTKPWSRVALATTDPTLVSGSTPDFHGGKTATNRLSGTRHLPPHTDTLHRLYGLLTQ
jgi:hypothetical protein